MIERHKAIEMVLAHLRADDLLISTTGMISREAFTAKDRPGNFYMIGSMGLASSLGLGLAITQSEQRVVILEGDGSALMSLGTLPLIATEAPTNLVHVVLDNEAYESTGAQPSISSRVSIAEIGRASGYKRVAQVEDDGALLHALTECDMHVGPHLVLVKASIAPVPGIPRVSHTPEQIRDRFKASVNEGWGGGTR